MRAYWRSIPAIIVLIGAACSPTSGAPSGGAPAANPAAVSGPAQTAEPAAIARAQPQAPAPSATETAAGAARLQADAAAWERFKEGARREGRVVVSGPGFPGLRQALTEAFQNTYGIAVEYLGLAPGEVIPRVDRESQAGNVTIDVNIGGTSSCWAMADRG